VTFTVSMLERVIEERARDDMPAAGAIRAEVTRLVGDDLGKLKPGSAAAMRLKEVLIQQGAWSQYLAGLLVMFFSRGMAFCRPFTPKVRLSAVDSHARAVAINRILRLIR